MRKYKKPAFHERQYNILASVLSEAMPRGDTTYETWMRNFLLDTVVKKMMVRLAEDNPQFDPEAFLKAIR